ncbi:MAG: hypothetical protein OXS35_09520 [Dehalococcoidia bacterium]|nr:hypothetical protein [Dehalococcoidia bacterium]
MLYRLIAAAFVLAVGTAAYFGVHYAGTVFADDPPPAQGNGKSAVEIAAEADQAKPIQNGAVNGIFITSDASGPAANAARAQASAVSSPASPCTDKNPPTASAVSGAGELDFTYPSSWSLLDEWATSCGDTAMSLYREMEPANDPLADILVMRWRGADAVELQAAADRVSAVTVDGKKAVHIAPVRTATGVPIDPDQLVVTESWGLTMVVAWQTSDSLSARAVYEAISGTGDDEETS